MTNAYGMCGKCKKRIRKQQQVKICRAMKILYITKRMPQEKIR